MTKRLRIAILLILMLSTVTRGQEKLVVDVNLTTLEVRVQAADGHFVMGLTPDDFEIAEKGVPKEVFHFGMDVQPVAIGLLVDRSVSIEPVKNRIDETVGFLLEASNVDDQVFLMTFAGSTDLQVAPTTDRAYITRAMRKVKLGYGTHFYDAVAKGLQYVAKSTLDRKTLVILSDGADHYSSRTFDDILAMARRLGIAIHVIGYVGEDPLTWTEAGRRQIHRQFEELAGATEGLALFPSSSSDSFRAARRILDMSRYEYRFSFYASDRFTDVSAISVRLRGNRSDELVVRLTPLPVTASELH